MLPVSLSALPSLPLGQWGWVSAGWMSPLSPGASWGDITTLCLTYKAARYGTGPWKKLVSLFLTSLPVHIVSPRHSLKLLLPWQEAFPDLAPLPISAELED